MNAPAEEVSLVVLVNCQWCSTMAYKGRLSLLSPVLGETDAPAPVRAKEWAREGEGCSRRVVPPGGLKPSP